MPDLICKKVFRSLPRVVFFASFAFFIGIFNSSINAQEITYEQAVASLKTNRDRLLDSYALQTGRANRQQAWNEMTTTQKGVFLTITDLLGRRTFMRRNYNHAPAVFTPNQDDFTNGCVELNGGLNGPRDIEAEGAYITPFDGGPGGGYVFINGEWVLMPAYNSCELVSADICVQRGHCYREPLPRTDHDMALNHVVTLYAVNGNPSGGCGGIDNNRMFFSVDDDLMYAFRNIDFSAPVGWRRSEDLGGPHSPFTQSRETMHGTPRGQVHEWAWDYQAVTMTRPGVYGVFNPRLVEMDIDYNWIHDSNPECTYGGVLGRYEYQNRWWGQGLGGAAEFDYSPY